MTYKILVTGRNPADKRVIERALYSGWEITGWTESTEGFACIVQTEIPEDFAYTYQIGRLQSFGSWGVRPNPAPGDIVSAVFRIAPKGAPA